VNFNITELDLSDNLITDVPTSLQQYLRNDVCALLSLNLNCNPLSSTSVVALLNSLHSNMSLQQLSLV
jgi:Leucine-rich repeat (LRR) protein